MYIQEGENVSFGKNPIHLKKKKMLGLGILETVQVIFGLVDSNPAVLSL